MRLLSHLLNNRCHTLQIILIKDEKFIPVQCIKQQMPPLPQGKYF